MYELWYEYIKPKDRDRAKWCYADTDSFVIYIITEDFYKDIAGDVERWFDTSNNDENKTGRNKKETGIFKDELGAKIMKEFCGLRAKTYAYLPNNYDDNDHDVCKNKKSQRNKKVCN